MRRLLSLAFAIVVGLALPASPLFARCGVERWEVKTGTDVDAAAVDLSSTTPTDRATRTASCSSAFRTRSAPFWSSTSNGASGSASSARAGRRDRNAS